MLDRMYWDAQPLSCLSNHWTAQDAADGLNYLIRTDVYKRQALLYAQAQLIEGLPVDDPAAYAEAVCSLMK